MTRTDLPGTGTPPQAPGGRVNRRRFLLAGGATAVGAAAAGFGGQYLQNKRFTVNTSAVKIAPVKKAPPLPKGADINDIPGLSPFYTPNAQFYRVDTALVIPQVPAASWQLHIHGMVDHPMTITLDDLMKLPMQENDITLTSAADAVSHCSP